MFPPFSEKKAEMILQELIQALYEGSASLEQTARVSEERKNQGIMLGVLVCLDKSGKEVNLVTNSGNAKKLKLENKKLKVIDSIVSAEEIENALSGNDRRIHEITEKIQEIKSHTTNDDSHTDSELAILNRKLKELCGQSLEKVHALYNFHCIDGKVRTLREICAKYNHGKLPPTGTGDCCAPKLLDYAFSHDLQPISLAECPYKDEKGRAEQSPVSNNYTLCIPNISLLPPCDERCGILLPAMLGLRILYRDEAICVVNKESGILSVPGRTEDKKDCVESRFKRLFGEKVEIAQPAVHRLDMETSGVMILAFTKEAHREMNRQFEAKEVQKEYIALLDGVLAKKGIPQTGSMELFFRLDVDNRPHQIWDAENGKSAVTEWKILGVERYRAPDGSARPATRVLFKPRTGRTHQLRLVSADSHGFGIPIIGDTLYGKCEAGERLLLHAQKVSFSHPVTGEKMTIECEAEF